MEHSSEAARHWHAGRPLAPPTEQAEGGTAVEPIHRPAPETRRPPAESRGRGVPTDEPDARSALTPDDTGRNASWTVDYPSLGRRLDRIMTEMIHKEDCGFHGAEFYGEALRRLVESCPDLVTAEERDRQVDAHRQMARIHAERADKARYEANNREDADVRKIRQTLADALLDRAQTITSRYRREGVELAASWLNSPKTAAAQNGTCRSEEANRG